MKNERILSAHRCMDPCFQKVKIIHQILEASLIYSDESGYNEFDSVFLANYLKLSAYCVETGPL